MYLVIITIVAVLVIGTAGYFYWQYNTVNKKMISLQDKEDSIQKDLDSTKQELTNTKASFDEIKPLSAALKAVLGSFTTGGDAKVGAIGATEAALAKQKISEITDTTDRIGVGKSWDDFTSSAKFNDLQPVLTTLSSGIDRSIENAAGHPVK